MSIIRPMIRPIMRPMIRPVFRGGGFTPLSLFANGEQGAWYDPSDLTTLYQDSAGTTPVTADGDPVGMMLDKSGNGNHASQSTAAARPVYRTDGTLHWLEFDGVDDRLTYNSAVIPANSYLVATAGRIPAPIIDVAAALFLSNDSTSSIGVYHDTRSSPSRVARYAPNTYIDRISQTPTGTLEVVCAERDPSGGGAYLDQDLQGPLGTAVGLSDSIRIGSYWTVFGRFDFFGAILIDTQGSRESVVTYLASKQGRNV